MTWNPFRPLSRAEQSQVVLGVSQRCWVCEKSIGKGSRAIPVPVDPTTLASNGAIKPFHWTRGDGTKATLTQPWMHPDCA